VKIIVGTAVHLIDVQSKVLCVHDHLKAGDEFKRWEVSSVPI